MSNLKLGIRTYSIGIKGEEIERLSEICKNNNIDFNQFCLRCQFTNSVSDALYTICFNSELINAIVIGLITNATYDVIKNQISYIILKIKSDININKTKSPILSTIELQSPTARLKIKSDKVTSDVINKAIDAFIDVSNKSNDKLSNKFIVCGENIEVLDQNELIEKYGMNNSTQID